MLRSASAARCVKASLRFNLEKFPNHIKVTRLLTTRTVNGITKSSLNNAISKAPGICQPWNTYFSNLGQIRLYSLPPYTKIDLPALSPTMEMGTIASWVLKEGDHFEAGDLIAEIETDKATVGIEAQDDGYIAKILLPEGTKDVPLNTLIAITVENEEDVAAFKDFTADEGSSSPPAPSSSTVETPATPPPSPAAAVSSYPRHERIDLPALSPTMTTGTIAKWAVKEGDKVEEGDLLADIETDKATMAVDAQNDGFIAKILVPDGSKDIPLGTLLCIQVETESDVAAFANYVDEGPNPAQTAATPAVTVPEPARGAQPVTLQPSPFQAAPKRSEGRVFVSPLARKLAIDKGVNLSQVQGSGPNGRIRQQDVLLYLEKAPKVATSQQKAIKPSAPVSQPASTAGDFIDIPLSNIRKTTAKRLLESKQNIPHYYLTVDCSMGKLIALRKQFNTGDVKLSVNDFIIKAAALSCSKVPEVNSSWQDTFIRQYNNVDVSVAVSTDTGLITPIVFNAHTKGLSSISHDVHSLAQKARDGKLKPAEFMGGTFTISNLGMFGIKQFTAIINPPQSCILAVGKSREECVPDKDSETGFSPVTLMAVTLSCDHRVVDGAVGATWLQQFQKYIENPTTMLL